MPTINTNSSTTAATLNLASPPKLGPVDPINKFKQLLARASTPKKGDPQPVKKAFKPAKPPKTAKPDSPSDSDADAGDQTIADSTDTGDKPEAAKPAKPQAGGATPTAKKQDPSSDTESDATTTQSATNTESTDGASLVTATAEQDAATDSDAETDSPAKPQAASTQIDDDASMLAQVAAAQNNPPPVPTTNVPAKEPTSTDATTPQSTTTATAATQPSLPQQVVVGPDPLADKLPPTSTEPATAEVTTSTATEDVSSTDESDTEEKTDATALAAIKTPQSPATTGKKASVIPGQMRPIPQATPAPTDVPTIPNPLIQPVATASTTAVTTDEKAVESIDSDSSDDRSAAKADMDVTPDPTQLLASDKPAAQSATPTFASHLAATANPADVAANNHDKIVQVVKSDLTPGGGTMKIRLDPPELGALQVTVKMTDGVMTASFETSTDQATKMLSHSLGQLKTALENSGVSVEKLHVQQSPKDSSSDNGGNSKDDSRRDQTRSSDEGSQQQRDQQRKEMIRRMWAKLGVGDPLDLVA